MTNKQRKYIWLGGVISEAACIVTMMLTGKNEYFWLFVAWGMLSAFVVLWSSRDVK